MIVDVTVVNTLPYRSKYVNMFFMTSCLPCCCVLEAPLSDADARSIWDTTAATYELFAQGATSGMTP